MSELSIAIKELRAQGKSYRQIANELHCSKSVVAYHCSDNQKLKTKQRKVRTERWLLVLQKKVDNFKRRKKSDDVRGGICTWDHLLRTKVSFFRNRNNMKPKVEYTTQDVLEKFGGTKVKCALTGRELDLRTDPYCLDHIIPVDKGGSNELSNMEITCPEANAAKNNLTNDEFIRLCIEVLTNFGYEVSNRSLV